ncbi:uncharacterized protein LOC105021790 isoform X1 [Esox lucius]|uniref:uncharacterized protein LOC105021790 isoform X1 n=1 Tax=Esox lucius TaxID=8010 RepID=UPI0014771C57|nr:uncharacterized protein LOC105021790 isoform X1 [Esox lucius]
MALRFQVLRKEKTMTDRDFERQFVDAHNDYRQKHGAPPLSLSKDLCNSAQKWANHLLSSKCLKHSSTDHGENLYYASSSVPKEYNGKDAVDSWYSEIKDYHFDKPGFTSGTGHFTQVVWKDSREVGVGIATDGKTIIVVGQYHPAGNISNAGYFEKNVLLPGSSPSDRHSSPVRKPDPSQKGTTHPEGKGSDRVFERQFVDAHNVYRQKHGAPPLTLSRDLCNSAHKWANHLLSSKSLQHSSTDHGENLYYAYSSAPKKFDGKDAVDNWYSEIKDYHFDKPGFTSGTGHFTQVVWKDSREVGVGIATDGKTIIVVGQYHPAGNISNAGYFEKNVLPPGSSPSDRPSSPVRKRDPSQKGTTHPEGKGSDRDFESQFVDAHNDYRQKHGAPPLTLSKDLCNSAQKWADHLLSSKCLKHSSTDHGENLYYASSSVPKEYNGKDAVDKWYSEIKDYHFDKSGFTPGTGHFTQVVWKDSREVGVGIATDGKTIIVVGQYHPAGNISNAGYFEKNVLPPGSSPSDRPSSPVGKRDPSQKGTTHPEGKGSDRDFESQFVDAHNDYRQKHGAPPLTLSKDLCNSAQKWADHLLSLKCLEHSSTDHGENLYYASSSVPKEYNGKDAVDKWYSEIKDYHFDKSGFTPGTGHFTQVVWKDSREVGVGIATDGKTIIVVGQYNPAGNISNAGYFEKNVLPPGSSPSDRPSSPVRKPDPSQKGTTHPERKGSASELDTFVRDLLTSLNQYRSQHGAGRLELSSALTREAQEWADHLISINRLMNSNRGHGENILCLSGSSKTAPTGSHVAESWYKEIENYDFSSPGFKNGAGNFTQMVWKSSKQVGLGLATNGLGKFIAVAFFDPAGNINNTGYFHDNVKTKGSRM